MTQFLLSKDKFNKARFQKVKNSLEEFQMHHYQFLVDLNRPFDVFYRLSQLVHLLSVPILLVILTKEIG
jgi:hypothetical protein